MRLRLPTVRLRLPRPAAWRLTRLARQLTPAPVTGLHAGITTSRDRLLGFGRQSDEEFTAVARGLSKLMSRLGGLRDKTQDLRAIITDTDQDRAVASAFALYKSSVDLAHASAGIAQTAEEHLGLIEERLQTAFACRDQFHRNYLFLNILQMGIKIESTRIDPAERGVFLNVASDIAEISSQIFANTERAFQRVESVISETEAERGRLRELTRLLRDEAQQKLRTIELELEALRSSLVPCAEQCASVQRLLDAAVPQVLRVVTSLQHQDIVRQQLEHVADGFHDMGEHLWSHRGADRRRLRPDSIEWAYIQQATAIQTAQLASGRDEITDAGRLVLTGLEGSLALHSQMVEQFVDLEQTILKAIDGCNIAKSFSAELTELHKIVALSQDANQRIFLLVDRITEVARTFKDEIAHQEFNLQLVALNAQVASLRLPSASALNRLGEEASHLSALNGAVTHELVGTLLGGLEKLNEVKHETNEFMTILTREKTELESGTREVEAKLTGLITKVRLGSRTVREEFEPVHRESQALTASLDFPNLIAATFAPAEELCTRLAEVSTVRNEGRGLSARATEHLARHQQRYTMDRENATHTAALAVSAAPAAPNAAANAAGDDIELFGVTETPAPDTGPASPAAILLESAAPPAAGPVADAPVGPVPAESAPAGPATAAKPESFGDGIELF